MPDDDQRRPPLAQRTMTVPRGMVPHHAYYPRDVQRPGPGLENSRLHGTGRVADDLYLIAHHETSGKPYLSPRAVGIGLAGAMLAELLIAIRPAVALENGRMFPLYRRNGELVARYAGPDEPVAQRALDLIAAESQLRPVRDWLLFLGRTAPADVAGRLEHSGYLTRSARWLPWLAGRPVPVQGDWSQCALLRAHAALDLTRTLTPYSALLNRLTLACGLTFRFSGFSTTAIRGTEEVSQMLPDALQELVAHVQEAADAAVLSART